MKVLIILALGFGVMFGIVSPRKAGKKIGVMLLFPLLLTIAWSLFSETWNNISPHEKIALLIGGSIILLTIVLIGTPFGREVFAAIVGNFIYDVIKTVVSLPSRFFRFLSRKF